MAPIILAARKSPELDVRICVTGQHRDLLYQVLEFFCVCPDHDLAAMQHDQNLSGLTARILEGLRPILLAERPDLLLVQGDTISAYAGALAGFFEKIPVGHVEAVLRTRDLDAPFPEEGLRQMISRLANLHFAPTERNVAALLDERVSMESIYLTGNPGVDAVLWARDHVRRSSINPLSRYMERHATDHIGHAEHVILVTGHRRENFGSGLRGICAALAEIASQHPNAAIVYPVLVTRRSTERAEAVDTGGARIVGTETSEIVLAISELLCDQGASDCKRPSRMPFGDGSAAEKIVRIIEQRTVTENRYEASIQALIAAVGYSPQMEAQADAVHSRPELVSRNPAVRRVPAR
jgi:UDP-N-acetylglucosamine 2-epimerase (non-hydrolysing)